MIRALATCFILAARLCAQTQIENTGAPMRVQATCTEAESQEAGLSCTAEQPCAIYLELSGVESVLSKIFVAGNLHTPEATLSSILLASPDGGKTWSEPHPRLKFTSLDQIQFIDFETGWISGANVQGVPGDPFFLVTNDGGKTWTPRAIFDESRTGIVERFWFESKTSGRMLMTTKLRHELYETQTGGDSWSMRQFSKEPIAFRLNRSVDAAAIRLRADSKLRAYLVEKRQGERWVAIASFLVDAGACKE